MLFDSKLKGRKRRLGASLAFIAGVVALVAVFAGSAASTTQAQAAQKTSKITPGGTLHLFNDTGSVFNCNFSPFMYTVSLQDGYVYEPLVITNAFYKKGVPREYKMLASSYKWAKNNRSVTFTIRKGVKWSDGQPLTAADVVFTFNLIKKYPALDVAGAWNSIKAIKQNGNKVIVQLKRGHIPGFDAIAGNTYIVPQHIWANIADPTKYVDSHPVGTGPFTVQSCSPQLIVYTKNTNYWQPGRPYINKIIFPDYTSNDAANHDLETSPLADSGVGGDFIPNIENTYIAKDPAHRHYWMAPVNNWSLTPNDTNPLLKNPLVRQAISYAINRNTVSKKAEDGEVLPASQTGNIIPFRSWYNKAADKKHGYFKHNPQKAIALLKKAGFVRGSDGIFRTKSGKKLKLSIIEIGAFSDSVAAATTMAANMRAVGIDVHPESLSINTFLSRLNNGQFTLAWAQVAGSVTPYYEYYNLLDSKNTAPNGKPALSNYERWKSKRTDKLLAEYGSTRNSKVQHRIIRQIQAIMVNKAPVIPVLQGVVWYEWSDKNIVGWPTKQNPYANPCIYCTTQDMAFGVVLTHIHLR